MRAAICVLLVVALMWPLEAACVNRVVVEADSGGRSNDRVGAALVDSGAVLRGDGGDGSGLGSASDHGFWPYVVRTVLRIIRDGVVYDIVKYVVRKSMESPPKPVRTPGWGESGCGMGAAGGSRF